MSNRYIYANEFNSIFDVFLVDYWDKWLGFDAVKFDNEVIKAPNGVSAIAHITDKYGQRAADIINDLVSESPLVDRLSQI